MKFHSAQSILAVLETSRVRTLWAKKILRAPGGRSQRDGKKCDGICFTKCSDISSSSDASLWIDHQGSKVVQSCYWCSWLFLNITCGFLFNLSFVSCSERVTCEIFSINIVKMWFLAPCVWICVIYEYWLECWCLNFKWVIICVHLMILAQPLERQNMNIKLASLLRFTCSLRVQLSTSL